MRLSEVQKGQVFVYKNVYYVKSHKGKGQIVQAKDYYQALNDQNKEPTSFKDIKVDSSEWQNPEVLILGN